MATWWPTDAFRAAEQLAAEELRREEERKWLHSEVVSIQIAQDDG